MLETSARLLRLLTLFQGRRYWSGRDLAERLEVTSRTLRRDVDKLRSLGYPIHSAAGVEGGYQMGAGSAMPPLLLDDEEAVAVALGLRAAATGGIQGMEDASLRALTKMDQILPPRLSRRVAALQAMIVTGARGQGAVDARLLAALAAACRDQETVRFRYSDREGAASARWVEPLRVVNPGWRWYLVAWDLDRGDWRTFRVDRIEGRVTAGARFTPRPAPADDLAAYVSRRPWPAQPCRGSIRLMLPPQAAAQRIGTFGTVEPIDERSCLLETGSHTWEDLALQVAFLNADFEVAGPPELAAAVARLGARYRRAARTVSLS